MKKHILMLLLTLVLCVTLLPMKAEAATTVGSGSLTGGVKWSLDSDGVLSFTGSGQIPAYSFSSTTPWKTSSTNNSVTITSVSFGSGITGIGGYSMLGLDGLTEVTIPSNVDFIGSYAFQRCTNIKTVTIEGASSIAHSAFDYCNALETVYINSANLASLSPSIVNGNPFSICPALKAIYVTEDNPNFCDVDGILFSKDMTGLYRYPSAKAGSSYIIPGTVKYICADAFREADNLTSVTLSQNLTAINYGIFQGCGGLTSIAIPEGVTRIYDNAFYNCTALSQVSFPSTLTAINSQAFRGCWRISSIELPEGLKTIGSNCFSECRFSSVVIPSTVTKVDTWAFSNNPSFSKAIILSKTCTIGEKAFYYYNASTPPEIHGWAGSTAETYAEANSYTFTEHNPNQKQSTQVAPGCETTGIDIYGGCSCGVTDARVVEALGHSYGSPSFHWAADYSTCQAEYTCRNSCGTTETRDCTVSAETVPGADCQTLETIVHTAVCGDDQDTQTVNGTTYGPHIEGTPTEENRVDPGCNSAGGYDLVVYCSVCETHEMSRTFVPLDIAGHSWTDANCTYPKTCSSCGATKGETVYRGHSFVDGRCEHCHIRGGQTGAKAWWILDDQGLMTMYGTGNSGWYNNNYLPAWHAYKDEITTVVIESGLETLCPVAFYEFTNLTDVTIADTVTMIESMAFRGCTALTEIHIPDSVTRLTSSNEAGSVFAFCTGLTKIVIPDSVTELGEYTFYGCTALEEVILPDTLTFIENRAFYGCTELTSVYIPASVETINQAVFHGCTKLEDVYFGGSQEASAILTDPVPAGTRIHWDCTREENHWSIHTVDPTCTVDGYTYEDCVCGYERNKQTGEAAPGHDYESVITEPTCEDDGFTTYTCSVCGDSYVADEVEASGHSYEAVVTDPTCEDGGFTTYTCSVCGDSYVDDEVEASGHSYDAVVTDPTCEDGGFTTYTCSVCGDSYVADEVEASGHSYKAVVTDPTCEDDGYTTYTCSVCGDSYVADEVEASGHSYEAVVTDPTCEDDGYTTYTCSVCGDAYADDEVAASGHSYEKGNCSVCGEADPDYIAVTGATRLSGKGRCETAFLAADELKTALGVEKFSAVIIASGDNFADALAGSYLAAVKNAPILLYRNGYADDNAKYIADNMVNNGVIYILGGTAAVPEEMEAALETYQEYTVIRVKGANRFETNLEILKIAGVEGKDILVATGYNFADSLSASATGMPILLVHNGGTDLTDSQKDFLDKLDGNNIVVIGGEGAVNASLYTALENYGDVERVKGSGREATSVAIAEKYFKAPQAAVVAYSRNFPDGLCGGPLAYALGAPLLLTNTGYENVTADYTADGDITDGFVLGGTKAVSDEIVRTVFAMAMDAEIIVKR